jgi:hypothetical protein
MYVASVRNKSEGSSRTYARGVAVSNKANRYGNRTCVFIV